MPAATPKLQMPYPVAADTADVPRDIKALADKLDGIGAWQVVGAAGQPYTGTWTADPTTPLWFRARPDGTVEFQGGVKPGVSSSPVFTLPAAYRPARYINFPATGSIVGGIVPAVSVQLYITGEVYVFFSSTVPIWISLDGVRYSVV